MTTRYEPRRSARWLIALSALMIACGGFLLGVQRDANGAYSGTGYAALALGALVALVGALLRWRGARGFPRDFHGAFAALASFLGFAFVFSGVLAPGGPWMFFELFVLLAVAARAGQLQQKELGAGVLWLLVLLLCFRLWVTYQGSENHWQLLSMPVPILAQLPFDFLDPVKSIELGSFTPRELGFPPAGLSLPITLALWSVGFCLCAGGLFLVRLSAHEHENDRIHDLIHTLPPALAGLVERLVPEDDWEALGLHGLADRALGKRIEALVRERIQRQREFRAAFDAQAPAALLESAGFTGSIHAALAEYAAPAPRPPSSSVDASSRGAASTSADERASSPGADRAGADERGDAR